MSDAINHPAHYNQHPSGVECITIAEGFNFNIGNAIKYLWRAGLKSENAAEDLAKAAWYVSREQARLGQGSKPATEPFVPFTRLVDAHGKPVDDAMVDKIDAVTPFDEVWRFRLVNTNAIIRSMPPNYKSPDVPPGQMWFRHQGKTVAKIFNLPADPSIE